MHGTVGVPPARWNGSNLVIMDKVSTSKLRTAFSKFDLDQDDEINSSEFSKLCHHLGHHFSPSQLDKSFVFIAKDATTIKWSRFLSWWESPTSTSTLDLLRNSLAKQEGVYFGFTHDDWKNAALDPSRVMSWTVDDVHLALAISPQLEVIRTYLDCNEFNDVDGETFLLLKGEDLISKGVKPYHLEKFLRFTASLKVEAMEQQQQRPNNEPVLPPVHRHRKPPSRHNQGTPPMKRAPPAGVHPPSQHPPPSSSSSASSSSSSSSSRTNSIGSVDEIGTQWKKGQLIGRGSFGAVYMVLNESNGRFMAMKQVELGYQGDADEVKSLVSEI